MNPTRENDMVIFQHDGLPETGRRGVATLYVNDTCLLWSRVAGGPHCLYDVQERPGRKGRGDAPTDDTVLTTAALPYD